jgi:hypothetical protein
MGRIHRVLTPPLPLFLLSASPSRVAEAKAKERPARTGKLGRIHRVLTSLLPPLPPKRQSLAGGQPEQVNSQFYGPNPQGADPSGLLLFLLSASPSPAAGEASPNR